MLSCTPDPVQRERERARVEASAAMSSEDVVLLNAGMSVEEDVLDEDEAIHINVSVGDDPSVLGAIHTDTSASAPTAVDASSPPPSTLQSQSHGNHHEDREEDDHNGGENDEKNSQGSPGLLGAADVAISATDDLMVNEFQADDPSIVAAATLASVTPSPFLDQSLLNDMRYLFKNTRYFLLKSNNYENVRLAKELVS